MVERTSNGGAAVEDSYTFQVDLRGIVDLLSHHLYSSPRVYLRELLQNAVDAVTARAARDRLAPTAIRISVDERGFEMVRRIRRANDGMPRLPLAAFKALVRDQFLMLLIDREASLAAIPSMLPAQQQVRERALDVIRQVLSTRGAIDGEMAERFKRIEGLFGTGQSRDAGADAIARAAAKDAESRKAS